MNDPNPSSEFTRTSSPHAEWIASARAEAAHCVGPDSRAETTSGLDLLIPEGDTGFQRELESRYDIGAQIRRGGQGVVFRGVQRGTRREVAIKVLHAAALADPHSRIRFEREAQILAQLKHPNIVTVLESGAAGPGLYFVMDFIPGAPLDEFVRKRACSPRDVLALLAKVCDAVNIAHLRGIIHRDLKPGNVRVDPSGEPHILDFGLAKLSEYDALAAGSDLQTQTGQFLGSLPWASPEQVAGRSEQLDIRTDIYSIGVMLFHALTGRFPYRVDGAMRSVVENICVAEPPRPGSLAPAIDDDIDQIVLKCLRKDADLRYQTAGDVAREIRRYLAGEPIEAKRDSTWYMLKKRLRRYRAATAIVGLVVLLLVNSLVAMTLFYRQEHRLRREAEDAKAAADEARQEADAAREYADRKAEAAESINEFFSTQLLVQAMPEQMGRDVALRDVLNAASDGVDERGPVDPRARTQIHFTLAATFRRLGDLTRAEHHARRAAEVSREAFGPDAILTLECDNLIAKLCNDTGRLHEAAELCQRLLEARVRLRGREHEDTLTSMGNLGWIYFRLGRHDEAVPLLREAYETRRRLYGLENEQTLLVMHNLAGVLAHLGQLDESATLRDEQLAAACALLGPDHETVLLSRSQLAWLHAERSDFDAAEEVYRDVLARQSEQSGPAHPSTLITRNNLASLLSRAGRREDAAAILAEALPVAREQLGISHPTVVSMSSNLGELYQRAGRYAEALELHDAAVAGAREYLPADHAYIGLYLARLGRTLLAVDRFEQSEQALLEGYRILRNAGGESEEDAREAAAAIESLYTEWDRPDKLAAWRGAADGAGSRE
jgi:tetratricopeptide (TPR) repeat protein